MSDGGITVLNYTLTHLLSVSIELVLEAEIEVGGKYKVFVLLSDITNLDSLGCFPNVIPAFLLACFISDLAPCLKKIAGTDASHKYYRRKFSICRSNFPLN